MMSTTRTLTSAARRAANVAVAPHHRRPISSQLSQGLAASSPRPHSYFQYKNEDEDRRPQHQHNSNRFHSTISLPQHPIYGYRNDDNRKRTENQLDQQPQRRSFHSSPSSERAAAIILGLASVSALAYAGSSAISSYQEWKASQPTPEELEEMRKKEEREREAAKKQQEEQPKQQETAKEGPRDNIFRQWFDVGTKYYEGGFEDTMTRREAALILGVRESSSPARIKEAHRKLLVLNHPDTGGSTFMALKINEAKELLLKGKAK
jgi:DnaJ homolog subfamily C member 19